MPGAAVPRVVVAIAAALLGWAAPAVSVAGPWSALVAEGARLWGQSPDPATPVACATCHFEAAEVRGWAVAYPRFRPLPPPHARVMTLLQANAEAVRRHYPGSDPQAMAVALTAYVTAQGTGRPLSPGIAPGEPVFSGRMQALTASVTRGGRGFVERCAACHAPDPVAEAAVAWWRLVRRTRGPVEVFLESHEPGTPPLTWESSEMADLLAYLVGRRAGRPLDLRFPPDTAAAGQPSGRSSHPPGAAAPAPRPSSQPDPQPDHRR